MTAMSAALFATTSLAAWPAPSVLVRLDRRPRLQAGRNASKQATNSVVTFEPFNEVKGELATVSKADTTNDSLARLNWDEECEAAVNEQINVEYNISYVYHALHSYFNRDNVGLPGLAKYFKESSDEEREHAQLLMNLQSVRGGRVKLLGIVPPESEFNNELKGDALYAMELSLSLEKLNFAKLRQLHDVACKHNDAQFADFIEGNLLQGQALDVKKAAVYVSMLRRVGPGHGAWHFDQLLGKDELGDVAQLAG